MTTETPILAGQVWLRPRRFRWALRHEFVKVLRVDPSGIWFSLIPGPTFQNVALTEPDFRKRYRLVPAT